MIYCSKRGDTHEKRFSILYKKDRSANMLSPALAAQMRSHKSERPKIRVRNMQRGHLPCPWYASYQHVRQDNTSGAKIDCWSESGRRSAEDE